MTKTDRQLLLGVLDSATARVAMWPAWKRELHGKTDEHLDIPKVITAIDVEIERLQARKAELLTEYERRSQK